MTHLTRNRSRLMLGCGSTALALALALSPQRAAAQGIDATGNVVFGSALITDPTANETLVEPRSQTVVIDWTPNNAGNFIRTGALARFESSQLPNFAVLNRILPDNSGNVAVIDGTVIARAFDPNTGGLVPGGFVAFYSPTGILVGNNASFDVGQLLLTTLDVSNTDFQNFAEFGGTMALAGAQGSTARIQINNGATITATPENSFFAVVAADVQMLGTAYINGSHAYVAGEVVGLRFSNGLFDISVPVGTAAGGTVMELAGNIGGPSSNGVGDNHMIYGVIAAQTDPISMIFRGNLGFDPVQSAGIVNGEIILSANYNVTGRTVDGGSTSDGIGATFNANSATSTVRADIFMEDFSASSSVLAIGTHSVQATVNDRDGFVLGNLLMVGRESAELTASGGYALDISGDVLVSAQDYGVVSSSYQTLAELDATGGTALIDAIGSGRINIGGNVLVAADAFAGFDDLNLIAGSAQGGQARIGASGGDLTIDGSATVTARGLGPDSFNIVTGATSRGGLAQFFSTQGGDVTLGGSLSLDASAISTNALASALSDAYGGNALLTISDGSGSIAIAGDVFASASATGGRSNNAGAGSLGDAGEAIANVDGAGQLTIGGRLLLEASGRGGYNDGGTGGIGLGGRASSRSNGGTISIGTNFFAIAEGQGGGGETGGDGFGGIAGANVVTGALTIGAAATAVAQGLGGGANSGFGGAGGLGRGGNAYFQAEGTLTESASLSIGGFASVDASGYGGRGGESDFDTIPGGRGGDGYGGQFTVPNQADPAFGSGAFLLAGGDNGRLTILGGANARASGYGGQGGEGYDDVPGGRGGDAFGGLAQAGLALLGQNGSLGQGSASFADLFVEADAYGGNGGLTYDDYDTGDGGNATGGNALLTVRAGTMTSNLIALYAEGEGGRGANGGLGTGGNAALFGGFGGRITANDLFVGASGFGGDGGLDILSVGNAGGGRGGQAEIDLQGIALQVNGDTLVEAEGYGGRTREFAGGDGTGGSARLGILGNIAGSGTFGGNTVISSNGFGGVANASDRAGDGFGGTSSLQALGSGTVSLNTVQVMANGFGAPAIDIIDFIGGNGTGGNADITASGTGSRITIARNVTTQQESELNLGAILSASGVGGRSTGGSGVGGTGRGGTATISATQGGSVALPADPINDPDSVGAIRVYARGIGGNSTVDGGTGGAGFGRNAIIEVDGAGSVIGMGATMVSVNGIGGSGSDPQAVRIEGGTGTGGRVRLTVSSSGTANLTNFEAEAGGIGGNGVGQGNGGNAISGGVRTELIQGTLNITSRFGQYSFARGGSGVIGGNASQGGEGIADFRAEDATITFAANGTFDDGLVLRSILTGGTGTQQGGTAQGDPQGEALRMALFGTTVTAELDLTIEAQAVGGRGAATGGDASSSSIDIAIRNSDLEAGSLRAVSEATGGDADLATGTGGDAQSGNIQLFTNPSRIGLIDANMIASIAQGGNAQIGGSASSGNITGELNQTELTVSGALSGAGLDLLSQARAGQGQDAGSNMGNATSGTVSLQLNDSAIFAPDLRLRTNASAESAIPEIGGGTATAGSNLLQLVGTAQLDVGNLLLDSTAATSIGQRQVQIGFDQMGNPIFGTVFDFSGFTTGGVSRILLAEGGTPQIDATFIDVVADTFGALFDADRAGRFSIEVLSGGINTLGLNARTSLFSSTQGGGPSQVIVRGGELIAQQANFTTGEDLLFITSDGGFIGGRFLFADAGNNITVIGEGTDRGVIEGSIISFNAGRSILLDGTLRSHDGTIALTANSDFASFQLQPQPAVITMSPDARIVDEDGGFVSISILDGAGDPQRQTGAITLGQITAGRIAVRHFGSTPGSDITVRADGVLTASGGGRAIDLASLNGEVINLAGDAGLILTGGGHYGIFAATPSGSQIGSLANYARRYNVLTEAEYDALNPGGNFAAFRISPVLTVTANNATRVYGNANPQFTASITGFLPGDGIGDLSGAPDLSTAAGVTSGIGTYAINAALGSLLSAQGYSFTFNPGVLTVTPRPITVTADDLRKLLGQPDPALTFRLSGDGLVNGDQLSGSLARDPGEGVGSFAIRQGSLSAGANYSIEFIPGTLTIAPPPAPPVLTSETLFEPPLETGGDPPVARDEEEDRFGIDFPEQPDAPLISEDPLLDDPVTSGGDASLYSGGTPGGEGK
jgi:hypothetical protein